MKQGWELKKLGEVSQVDWGNTKLTKKSYVPNGDYLAVSAAGCDGRIDHAEHQRFTPVLSAIGANCGRMFLPSEDFTAIKNTITIKPTDARCDSVFLYYLLSSVELPKRGAGQPFISKGDIQKYPISLPPLEEQKRIVAVLEEAFEGLETARTNAEANLKNAEELLNSTIQNQLNKSGWKTSSLSDCLKLTSGEGLTKAQMAEGEVPVYGGNGIAGYHDKHNRNQDFVIVGRVGALCGIARHINEPIWLTDNAFEVTDIHKAFNADFLSHLLNSCNLRDHARQTAQPVISNSSLKDVLLTYPESLDEQSAIANKIELAHQQTTNLKRALLNNLDALNDLRQSLLQRAFAGELT